MVRQLGVKSNSPTSSATPVVNHCLSIDVEGFVESMVESFAVPESCIDHQAEDAEISVNMEATLEFLDRQRIKGTFFVLGRIAERLPGIVRKIADLGHELASHSFYHKRLYNQSEPEFRQDVSRAKKLLEDLTGKQVHGFRAPDFSIREDSRWALDVLRDEGFDYDASLTPTDIHDVYGIKGTTPTIHRLANGLYEFPASTFNFLGRTLPFGGGGYMRLYPIWLSRMLLQRAEHRSNSCMLYMHPYEIGPDCPHIQGISLYRRFRHYYHVRGGSERLRGALQGFAFEPAISIINRFRETPHHD